MFKSSGETVLAFFSVVAISTNLSTVEIGGKCNKKVGKTKSRKSEGLKSKVSRSELESSTGHRAQGSGHGAQGMGVEKNWISIRPWRIAAL